MRLLLWISVGWVACGAWWCPMSWAVTVQTARGPIEITNGSTWHGVNVQQGTIEGLKDVTFIRGMFAREQPHSVVFVNCERLTFIDSNLVNVELQSDFTVKGSLTIHKWQATEGAEQVEYVERGDGKTERWVITHPTVDVVAREFPLLTGKELAAAKQVYLHRGEPVETIEEQRTLTTLTDTPNDRRLKARVVAPTVIGIPALDDLNGEIVTP